MDDFRFQESDHSYWLGDKRLTGVTSIIGVLAKPALIQWAANEACKHAGARFSEKYSPSLDLFSLKKEDVEAILEEARTAHARKKEAAGTHGTDAHALVEEYVNRCIKGNEGKPFPTTNGDGVANLGDGKFFVPGPIARFTVWANENVDHFLFSERRMFNKELFIAGTADFAYVGKDGKRYMADFKTSSGIYGIDYWLQVAAYRLLAEAQGDTPYDGATVVRLGKDGAFEVQQRFDYETDKEAFLACLKLYRAQATYTRV